MNLVAWNYRGELKLDEALPGALSIIPTVNKKFITMQMNLKRLAAEKAVEYIEDGMIVGLGTGSTAYWAIKKIGEKVKEGFKVKAVASSLQSEQLAKESGIPIVPFSDIEFIDITIDGADEVDKDHNLIKGGGGALLREKILAYHSRRFLVVVDELKLVPTLGKFPLPVEIIQFARDLTLKHIKQLGCSIQLRKKGNEDYISDNGNLIVDCGFNQIIDPVQLNTQLHGIPGVVETGLFLNNMVSSVTVGHPGEAIEMRKREW